LDESAFVEPPGPLAVTRTPKGRRLRAKALEVPGKIVARLGLPISDLEHMHAVLTRVIAAATES